MSAEFTQPEIPRPSQPHMDRSEVEAIADHANLAEESLEGAERLRLYGGESETFEPRLLKAMGDNGPIMVVQGSKSTAKLYMFIYTENGVAKRKYAVTPATFNNDEVDDHFHTDPVVYLSDRMTSAEFDIEADEAQIRVTDKSSEKDTGTSVIVRKKEQRPGEFSRLLNTQLAKRIVGRVAEDE